MWVEKGWEGFRKCGGEFFGSPATEARSAIVPLYGFNSNKAESDYPHALRPL